MTELCISNISILTALHPTACWYCIDVLWAVIFYITPVPLCRLFETSSYFSYNHPNLSTKYLAKCKALGKLSLWPLYWWWGQKPTLALYHSTPALYQNMTSSMGTHNQNISWLPWIHISRTYLFEGRGTYSGLLSFSNELDFFPTLQLVIFQGTPHWDQDR